MVAKAPKNLDVGVPAFAEGVAELVLGRSLTKVPFLAFQSAAVRMAG
jgi:hypothetical protein